MLAHETGWEPAKWSFVGPAKRRSELVLAVELGCGHLVVESEAQVVDPEVKIMAPPTACLSPIGDELLLDGLKARIEAEFYTTVKTSYILSGDPA